MIELIGGPADVRIHSDARETDGGLAAVGWFEKKFVARPIESLAASNEIYGLELPPMVAAAAALGGQLKGSRIILFLGNNASAGYLGKAASRAPVLLALIKSSWRTMGRLSATRLIKRAPSRADAADALIRGRKLPHKPHVAGELAYFQEAFRRWQILEQPTTTLGREDHVFSR